MPSTIRASQPRVLVLLLVAALLSATTASAHVPKPPTRVFGDENVRLDSAWSTLDLSEKPRLGDPREKVAHCPRISLCKSLNALLDSGALRSNLDRNVFFFQGRERDPATGLYDFRNRWYDANLARFVSFDPKPYVDGPNAYGGFVGNPVTMSDPNGEFVPAAMLIGGILNVGFGWAVSAATGGDYSMADASQDFVVGALSGGVGSALAKGGKALMLAGEVGVGAVDSQLRSLRETGEMMNFTDSVNQGALGTLTGRVGARALSGVAKPAFRAIGQATGVAADRMGKVLAHVRTPCKNSFVAGTEVATEYGQRPIEQIEVGDRVWAWDAAGESLELRRVLGTSHHPTGAVVQITVGDEEIVATLDHPFWVVDEGWLEAGQLMIGDGLVGADGRLILVAALETSFDTFEVYNFEVEDLHTYFVGERGAWVHNCPTRQAIIEGLGEAIQPHLAAIRRLDPDAQIGFRGSLARGRKHAGKGGGPFDPTHFDIDLFITSERLPPGLAGTPEIRRIAGALRRDLRALPEFSGLKGGRQKSKFRVWRPQVLAQELRDADEFQIFFLPPR